MPGLIRSGKPGQGAAASKPERSFHSLPLLTKGDRVKRRRKKHKYRWTNKPVKTEADVVIAAGDGQID